MVVSLQALAPFVLSAGAFATAFATTGKRPKDKAANDVFFKNCLLLFYFGVFIEFIFSLYTCVKQIPNGVEIF